MRRIEWPTLILILACYGTWVFATGWLAAVSPLPAILVTGVAVTLYASLCHEVIHGHPTPWAWLNALLVAPALSLIIPFLRFRDTHLDHHRDALLTDPYDDPETNYLDEGRWRRLPAPLKIVLRFNNTLLGRLLIGTAVSQVWFMLSDWRAHRAGDGRILRGWLWHLPALAPVLIWIALVPMSFWDYAIAAYIGNSLIKIRTFAEHQAHALTRARSVIIEDKGPLAFLFLNNNLHAVHHSHPGLAWYALPPCYRKNRDRYLARNQGYRFGSYVELFLRHFLRAKDPVPHPLWRRG